MNMTFFCLSWFTTSKPVMMSCSVKTSGPLLGLSPGITSVRLLSMASIAIDGNWFTLYSVAMLGSNSGSMSRNERSCAVDRRLNSRRRSSVCRHAASLCGVLLRKKAVMRIGSRRFSSVFRVASDTMNCFVAVVSIRNHPAGSGRSVAQNSR